MLLGSSRHQAYEGVKEYFKTQERLEQFEPKSVHILPKTQKGNSRHKVYGLIFLHKFLLY